MRELTQKEFHKRAKNIRLMLTDNDGVLTDSGVYYSERGEEFKRYSIRDGMGVERLAAAGIVTGIMTGENSPNLVRRAEKLKIELLYLGVKNKLSRLQDVLDDTGFDTSQLAYMGDDVNDLAIMESIAARGLTACPGDATGFVRPVSHYICSASGGDGAFREFAEKLIALRT